MHGKAVPEEMVIQFIEEQKVTRTAVLAQQFDCVKRTIFRILKRIGYITSYNRNSAGITLTYIPTFDSKGLWEYQGFRFSRWGNLRKTIQYFVENSTMGLTAGELRILLQHDNIYHQLTSLAQAKLIYRNKKAKIPVYYSSDPDKRSEQRKTRQKKTSRKKSVQKRKGTEAYDSARFDIEKVHFGYLAQLLLSDTVTAEDIYNMLDGMGKPAERREIQEIIIRYDLDKKKTQIELVFSRKGRKGKKM